MKDQSDGGRSSKALEIKAWRPSLNGDEGIELPNINYAPP